MNKIVKKWFWVWQRENEITFLHEMSLKGYSLIDVGLGKYTFEKTDYKRLVYHIDYFGIKGEMSLEKYLKANEEAGWKLIAKFGGWYYFSKEWKEGMDKTFVENREAKKRMYKRLFIFIILTGVPLYYQTIFIFSRIMPQSSLFIIRIIMSLISLIHFLVLIKIFFMYLKSRKNIP